MMLRILITVLFCMLLLTLTTILSPGIGFAIANFIAQAFGELLIVCLRLALLIRGVSNE
jgi:hypothetical protein